VVTSEPFIRFKRRIMTLLHDEVQKAMVPAVA
jgi:hypothetical protein